MSIEFVTLENINKNGNSKKYYDKNSKDVNHLNRHGRVSGGGHVPDHRL